MKKISVRDASGMQGLFFLVTVVVVMLAFLGLR